MDAGAEPCRNLYPSISAYSFRTRRRDNSCADCPRIGRLIAGPCNLPPLWAVAKRAKDSISKVADTSPASMKRTRAAFLGAVLGSCFAVSGLAYIGFVFATRPLHSELTADFVSAIVIRPNSLSRIGALSCLGDSVEACCRFLSSSLKTSMRSSKAGLPGLLPTSTGQHLNFLSFSRRRIERFSTARELLSGEQHTTEDFEISLRNKFVSSRNGFSIYEHSCLDCRRRTAPGLLSVIAERDKVSEFLHAKTSGTPIDPSTKFAGIFPAYA